MKSNDADEFDTPRCYDGGESTQTTGTEIFNQIKRSASRALECNPNMICSEWLDLTSVEFPTVADSSAWIELIRSGIDEEVEESMYAVDVIEKLGQRAPTDLENGDGMLIKEITTVLNCEK